MIQDITQILAINADYETMYKNMQKELEEYIVKSGLQSLVLGISGGVDSALCAALAKPVCEKLGIPLIGVTITIESNKQEEIDRAQSVRRQLCTSRVIENLTTMYYQTEFRFSTYLAGKEESVRQRKIRQGNIKARMRMIYLYNLAQYHKGMVLSTDNYTEYLLGFWTLHGDVGDYGMFQNLWKTEVYGLSQWIVDNVLQTMEEKGALQSCINAIPTDGLGITNSDLDQLGCSTYAEVDQHLLSLFFDYKAPEDRSESCASIYDRFEKSRFKRANPFNIQRHTIIRPSGE